MASILIRNVRAQDQLPVAKPPSGAGRSLCYWATVACSILSLSIPIWAFRYQGLVDYNNHLVRCYILAHYHENPSLQQQYVIVHSPVPDMAMDLITVPLAKTMDYRIAGKIFLEITLLVWAAGCHLLGRAVQGRNHWPSILGIWCLTSPTWLQGWVACQFGVAVFMVAFAYWYVNRERLTPTRVAICAILTAAAYLSHLVGYGLLVLACGVMAVLDFAHTRSWRSLLRQTWFLAIPLLLLAIYMNHGGEVGVVKWDPLMPKIKGLLGPLTSYNRNLNIALLVICIAVCIAIIRRVRWKPTILVSLALLVVFSFCPARLMTSWGADLKLVIPIYLIAFASISLPSGLLSRVAFALLLLVLIIKNVEIALAWAKLQPPMVAAVGLGSRVAVGSAVYYFRDYTGVPNDERPLMEANEYWTVNRGTFFPTLFAKRGQHLLNFRNAPCNAMTSDFRNWVPSCLAQYNYVLNTPLPSGAESKLTAYATKIATVDYLTLWKINNEAVRAATK